MCATPDRFSLSVRAVRSSSRMIGRSPSIRTILSSRSGPWTPSMTFRVRSNRSPEPMRPDSLVIGRAIRGRHPAAAAQRDARRRSRHGHRIAAHPSPNRSVGTCAAPCSGRVTSCRWSTSIECRFPTRSIDRLVADLRRDGCDQHTWRKSSRSCPASGWGGHGECFDARAMAGAPSKLFEILHFAAWTPAFPVTRRMRLR